MDAGRACPAAEYDAQRRQFVGAGAVHALSPLLVELAKLFSVSTDYLLGLEPHQTVNVSGLDEKDVALIAQLADRLRRQ